MSIPGGEKEHTLDREWGPLWKLCQGKESPNCSASSCTAKGSPHARLASLSEAQIFASPYQLFFLFVIFMMRCGFWLSPNWGLGGVRRGGEYLEALVPSVGPQEDLISSSVCFESLIEEMVFPVLFPPFFPSLSSKGQISRCSKAVSASLLIVTYNQKHILHRDSVGVHTHSNTYTHTYSQLKQKFYLLFISD